MAIAAMAGMGTGLANIGQAMAMNEVITEAAMAAAAQKEANESAKNSV